MSNLVVVWTLGDRLAKSRRLAGISREAMAEYLGMSPQAVSNYENDHRVPKLTVLRSWSARTGMDLGWLRYGDTPPGPGGLAEVREINPRPGAPSTGWLTTAPVAA